MRCNLRPLEYVDWSALVVMLKHRGAYTNDRLGRAVGSDWRHIGRLARGEVEQPGFAQGIRLITLAQRHLMTDEWDKVLPMQPLRLVK